MSHTPHDLHAEFPEDSAVLHTLKMNDAHFRARADHYHDLNREIHRIEIGTEPASDLRAEALKKSRLGLLDELSGMIAAARAATP
jgi:uncharacterized protein